MTQIRLPAARLPTTTSRTIPTAYAGILASVLAATVLLGAPWPAASLIGAFLLCCVPAGAGVMCWVDAGEAAAQAGLTLAISLASVAILSAIMIWTAAWEPHALLGLAVLSVGSCAYRLRHGEPS
ncbi:MAG: hypothetical protein JO262_16405 [Solirubrobacterales bacterium]|nr:hypothetical protein [Solirubrobacterales bacterium]MBV9943711.1 hypothetical protein [Solirubrobacterales bacterium]